MKILTGLLFVVLLGVSGCSVIPKAGPLSGAEVSEIDRSIVDGKTTSEELRSLYGDKHTVDKTAQGKDVLNWYSTWSTGFTQDTTVLSVLVDNKKIIKHSVLRYKTKTDYSFVSKLTDSELESFIIPDRTTRQGIEIKYGKPNGNSFDDQGNQIMLYVYSDKSESKYGWIPNIGGFVQALAGSVDTEIMTLAIPLNDKGLATSYQLKSTNYHQGYGLLNSSDPKEVK